MLSVSAPVSINRVRLPRMHQSIVSFHVRFASFLPSRQADRND
jgi:hypothetical protein